MTLVEVFRHDLFDMLSPSVRSLLSVRSLSAVSSLVITVTRTYVQWPLISNEWLSAGQFLKKVITHHWIKRTPWERLLLSEMSDSECAAACNVDML